MKHHYIKEFGKLIFQIQIFLMRFWSSHLLPHVSCTPNPHHYQESWCNYYTLPMAPTVSPTNSGALTSAISFICRFSSANSRMFWSDPIRATLNDSFPFLPFSLFIGKRGEGWQLNKMFTKILKIQVHVFYRVGSVYIYINFKNKAGKKIVPLKSQSVSGIAPLWETPNIQGFGKLRHYFCTWEQRT